MKLKTTIILFPWIDVWGKLKVNETNKTKKTARCIDREMDKYNLVLHLQCHFVSGHDSDQMLMTNVWAIVIGYCVAIQYFQPEQILARCVRPFVQTECLCGKQTFADQVEEEETEEQWSK
jgi:hypothetical protein